MKNQKINERLGSWMPKRCANPKCPNPFEEYLSVSGLDRLCPDCRHKEEIARIAAEREKRRLEWRNKCAGLRLIFGA